MEDSIDVGNVLWIFFDCLYWTALMQKTMQNKLSVSLKAFQESDRKLKIENFWYTYYASWKMLLMHIGQCYTHVHLNYSTFDLCVGKRRCSEAIYW